MIVIEALRTRLKRSGWAGAAPEAQMRAHGLQNRFNFDFVRLGRITGLAVAMMAGVTSALDLPFAEAIAFLQQKANVKTKSWRDVWDAAHSKMFMVAGANTDAIVADFKAAIAKALEQGTTLEAFRADFDQIVKTHGWSYRGERGWRTRTIFETNLRTAYAAGRYAQATDPDVLAEFPFWEYHHSGALHPRLQHQRWDGICLEATDPFWQTAYPPNGFGCGCFVISVSRSGLKRRGKSGPDRAPDLDRVGTDQPLGVDPSFAYNPGAAWLAQTAPGPKAVTASEANAAAFVRSAMRGKWPDGSWTPVGTADGQVASLLQVKAKVEVRLSAHTIRAHGHHPEADPDIYAALPKIMLREGTLVQDHHGRWQIVYYLDGRPWIARLKVARHLSGSQEIWLQSLHRVRPAQAEKLLRG